MEISPTGTEMSAAASIEARGKIEAIIGTIPPGEKLKTVLPAVARRLGMPIRRVRALWNAEAARIDSHEMDRLRAAAAKAETLRHAANLDGAAHALLAIDADFHGPEIDRLRRLACELRGIADQKRPA